MTKASTTILLLLALGTQLYAQPVSVSTVPALQGWATVNYTMNACTSDANCSFPGLSNACCATFKSVTGNTTTMLGNACVTKDIDFYTSTFTLANGTQMMFNCTINSTWLTYVPATWIAVNQTACTSDTQC